MQNQTVTCEINYFLNDTIPDGTLESFRCCALNVRLTMLPYFVFFPSPIGNVPALLEPPPLPTPPNPIKAWRESMTYSTEKRGKSMQLIRIHGLALVD